MRIAVIGTGGIGGPYGASLAKAGADVTFVARGFLKQGFVNVMATRAFQDSTTRGLDSTDGSMFDLIGILAVLVVN